MLFLSVFLMQIHIAYYMVFGLLLCSTYIFANKQMLQRPCKFLALSQKEVEDLLVLPLDFVILGEVGST